MIRMRGTGSCLSRSCFSPVFDPLSPNFFHDVQGMVCGYVLPLEAPEFPKLCVNNLIKPGSIIPQSLSALGCWLPSCGKMGKDGPPVLMIQFWCKQNEFLFVDSV